MRRILHGLNDALAGRGVRVSIPSQRMDAFGVDMAAAVAGGRRGGLTFAPEAGSQRLRDVINKNVTDEDVERAARNAYLAGWRRMKLYFMMGLPTETDEDVIGIAAPRRAGAPDRARGGGARPQERRLGLHLRGRARAQGVHAVPVGGPARPGRGGRRRQQLLLHEVRDRAIRVSYHDAGVSLVEGALSRMGRAGFALVRRAWELGCRFDAWTSEFSLERWQRAARDCGLDLEEIACEELPLAARLPWDHTSPGVSKGYLQREWLRATEGVTTPDCTRARLHGLRGLPRARGRQRHLGGALMRPQPTAARPQDLPVKADLARLRVEYGKDRRLALLGHLDLIATIERCVRRADLPFSIGNGFARRMRIQFSGALPVGASSACEYFDLRLDERVDAGEALSALRAATPSALAPTRAAYVPGRLPALEAWLDRASWEVVCAGASFSATELAEAIARGAGPRRAHLPAWRAREARRSWGHARGGLRRGGRGRRGARARDARRRLGGPAPERPGGRRARGGGARFAGGAPRAKGGAVARGRWASCGTFRRVAPSGRDITILS